MAEQRLLNKVAIVTGSSSGIGQSIAIRLAQEGADVVVDYIGHPEGADDTKKQIEAAGRRAVVVKADVSALSDVQNLITQAWSQLGRCDFLVNNAGMERKSDFWDVTESDFDKVMGVNFKGAFFLTQAFVQRLRQAVQPGRIVNISSVHEDMAFPGFATYCASKGALRMLMRDLAVELAPLNITINNIAPGAIATPINKALLKNKAELDALLKNIPLRRLGTPEDVASAAAFLLSDQAAYITGTTMVVDGGLMRNYHEQ
jgi:glucose 1-dehydrogenase